MEGKVEKEKEEKPVILNIHQRMLGVMKDVKYIQKQEKAAKGLPYKYITHDQVTGILHEAFVKWGIVATCSCSEFTQDGNRTTVLVTVHFINADDPKDYVHVKQIGYGVDNQDKGPGKAISYAFKMACLKNFMLETGEDPERDNIDYKPNEKENGFISLDQLAELTKVLNRLEEGQYYSSVILERNKIENIADLKADTFPKVMNWLKIKEKEEAQNA